MGLIAETRHVEEAGAPAGGIEDLMLEGVVPLGEKAVDKHERLERHNPVTGLAEVSRDSGDSGANIAPRVGREVEDLTDVLFVGGAPLWIP